MRNGVIIFKRKGANIEDKPDGLSNDQSLFDTGALQEYMRANRLGRFSATDLLDRILTTSPGIIYVYVPMTNHTLFASRGVLSVLGYPPEEVSRDSGFFVRITHPDDTRNIREWHRRVDSLSDGENLEMVYRMRHAEGHYLHLRCRETVFARDRSGSAALVIGSTTDVSDSLETRRELLEKTRELRRSEERYRLLVESSADAIIGVDSRMRITVWNPAAERIFGYRPEGIIGQSLMKIVPKSLQESKDKGFLKFRQSGEGRVLQGVQELEGVRKDGSRVPVEVSIAPMKVDDTWTATGIIRDISKRRDAERRQWAMVRELQRMQRLDSIGTLAGGIAHDFNNILSSVLGSISMARSRCTGDRDMTALLEQGQEAVLQARDLAGQLLTFAEGGEPVKEVVDVGPIVEKGCRFSLAGSGSRCSLSLETGLFVKADGSQVSQMVSNLALNASQAMSGSGVVKVRGRLMDLEKNQLPGLPEGCYVAIEVEDSGPGIPEDCAEKIFNPFFTTREGGHGLGLSVCYSIARQHGGTVLVESEPGEGALFRVLLPHTEERPAEELGSLLEKAPSGSRILVMDDDEGVRVVLRQMLESLGMVVNEASEGREAVELYKSARRSGEGYDLLIMDLTVAGGMGGAQAMQELVSIDPEVRALVASGYYNDPVMARHVEHGFSGVLKKPFTMAELRKALAGTLDAAGEA